MMQMELKPLKLNGVFEIIPRHFPDERGYFMTTYSKMAFEEHGLVTDWAQDNQSLSSKGVLRGLHFQMPPHAETKLVRVIHGVVQDVFVDLRKESATYGQWGSVELSEEKRNMVYIPKGFAHAFCVLSEQALVAYKVDEHYAPEAQAGLRWDDPTLNIQWGVQMPILSPKDSELALLAEFESPF